MRDRCLRRDAVAEIEDQRPVSQRLQDRLDAVRLIGRDNPVSAGAADQQRSDEQRPTDHPLLHHRRTSSAT